MRSIFWNNIYKKNQQNSEWPWPELIKYFHKYIEKNKNIKVLELGFGSGANIPFFLKNKINYFGIEVSKNIFNKVKRKFKLSKNNIFNYDFKKFDFRHDFDLIFDRCSLSYNSEKEIKIIIKKIYTNLKNNGYYFGLDWACVETINAKKSIYKKKASGPYANQGQVLYLNEKKIKNLFKNFYFEELNKNIYIDTINKKKYITLSFVVKKSNKSF